MHQQVTDFHYRKLLNPVAGSASAYLCGDLVQMLGRDTEFLGIIGYGTVPAIASALQHLDETRHDVGSPLCGFLVFEKGSVGTHDIQIQGAHTLQYRLFSVCLRSVFHAEGDITEVVFQNGEVFSLQPKDGVHEQMQPSAGSVAVVRHATGLLVGGQKELQELAVFRGSDITHMTGHGYHTASGRERMLVP